MVRAWTSLVVGVLMVGLVGCGDAGGDAADVPEADVAGELSWESIGAPLLSGFMKIESYGCRSDAIFVAISGGQTNHIHKLDLGDVAAGWKEINDQAAKIEPIKDHLILAFPEGKT